MAWEFPAPLKIPWFELYWSCITFLPTRIVMGVTYSLAETSFDLTDDPCLCYYFDQKLKEHGHEISHSEASTFFIVAESSTSV